MKVLLVEDNAGDADLIRECLSETPARNGFDIVHTTRLSATLEHLRHKRVDAVLLDLTLPDSSGIATVARVHERAPEVAIVVLTGHDDDDLAQVAIRNGAQDYFKKTTLDAGALAKALHHAIARARMQSRMRAVVERNADGVVVVGLDGVIRYVNPAAEALFERGAGELDGELFGYPIETASRHVIEIVGRDQGPKWAELRVNDFEWYEEPAYLVSLRDVTDRKRAEDLQQRLLHADRLAAIGQLAAGVAHEINNPAAFISANLTMLREEIESVQSAAQRLAALDLVEDGQRVAGATLLPLERVGDMAEMVEENIAGIERVIRIVRDLRSFSRIERDEIQLVDVNEVISVACNMTSNEIRHRAKLVRDLGRVPVIAADRGKLAQVFTNLLLNAAQAIEVGAADANRIRVSSSTSGDSIVLRVEDTGCGMPKTVVDRIYEPFFTTKPREIGTGLGLPLTAEIVRKHGGEIRVESTTGEGSCFEVVLPIETPLASEVRNGARPGVDAGGRRRARILVIDDELMLLRAFERLLGRHHDVVTARGGAAGLAMLRSDPDFDVIICDLMMPEVDGIAVHEAATEIAPALADRMVFCTGGAFTARCKDFVESVRNICLEKPVPWDLLMRVVDRITASRHSRRPAPG